MSDDFPKLTLINWKDGDERLIRSKGWFDSNYVELENGHRYQICFLDKIRLHQQLEDNEKNGQPFLVERALIILSEVTPENMREAIKEAGRIGFFENLTPINS